MCVRMVVSRFPALKCELYSSPEGEGLPREGRSSARVYVGLTVANPKRHESGPRKYSKL